MQSENQVNEVFYCPITGSLMKEPVLAQDGQTYEKAAIQEWIERHGKSPFTNEALSVEELQLNRPIQELIVKQQGLVEKIDPRIPDQPIVE